MDDARICKKCDINLKMIEDISEYVMTYIQKLPVEYRVLDEVLNERLKVCNKCKWLQNEMCAACGCYVAIRASVKKNSCPYEKW